MVLDPLLGKGASNISPSVISRLKSEWLTDYQMFLKRKLVGKRYVYWWVDGIYLSARMEGDKTCMLVIMGADEQGNKELVGLIDGFRGSKDSWLELLQDLKLRGLENGPKLGYW